MKKIKEYENNGEKLLNTIVKFYTLEKYIYCDSC